MASGLLDQGSCTPWFAITVSLLFSMLSVISSTAFLLVNVFALFLLNVASLRSLIGSDSGSVSEGGCTERETSLCTTRTVGR